MANRGKVVERKRARELRAETWTLKEFAEEVGASNGTVSVWVRDVDFEPRPPMQGPQAGPQQT